MRDIRFIGIIIGVFLLLIFLVFFLSADVGYKIKILDGDVPRGTDLILSYEIKNDLFAETIYNVKFYYWMGGETNPEIHETYPLISSGQSERDSLNIKTNDLSRGRYVVWTQIDYTRSGTLYSQYLSLNVEIY